jgi:hypothetical protein
MTDRRKFESFSCECGDMTHTIRFYQDVEPGYEEFGVEIFLNNYLPWYKRLAIAFWYALGVPTQDYSHYDTWMLANSDRERLVNLLAPNVRPVMESVREDLMKSPHLSTQRIIDKIDKVLPMAQRELNIAATMARGTPCSPRYDSNFCEVCDQGPCTGNVTVS